MFKTTFDNGDLEHDIVMDEVFGETLDKRAVTLKMLTDSGMPLEVAMKATGFSDEEIEEAVALKEKEQARQEATMLRINQKQPAESG